MSEIEEIQKTERERIKNLLREHGLDALRWPESESDVLSALQQGLQRNLNALLFAQHGAQYVVAEAQLDRVRSLQKVASIDVFRDGGYQMAPVCHETWLLPCTSHSIEVTFIESSVQLTIPCANWNPPDSQTLAQAELDIYCDPQDAPRSLSAFWQLIQGRWPEAVAFPHGRTDAWPKRGLRPVWLRRSPMLAPGAAELIDLLSHPLDTRFLRLPLAALAAMKNVGKPITLRIEIGKQAQDVARRLSGKLKLNHTLFWNRWVGECTHPQDLLYVRDELHQVEVSRILTEEDALLVLECWDPNDGRIFHDRRWKGWVDPECCYEMEQFNQRLRLRFPKQVQLYLRGGAHPEINMVYLLGGSQRSDPPTLLQRNGIGNLIPFHPRPDTFTTEDIEPLAQVLPWIAGGGAALPVPRVVTRRDLADLILRLMPQPLRRRLKESTNLPITQVVRPASQLSSPHPPEFSSICAYPVTVVTLSCQGFHASEDEELAYYRDWLVRAVTPHCPAGMFLEIQLKDGD